MYNFHVFVLSSTILFYVLLRSYRSSVESNNTTKKRHSNLIYILFIPITLYVFYYFFVYREKAQTMDVIVNSPISEGLMTIPYPNSSSNLSS